MLFLGPVVRHESTETHTYPYQKVNRNNVNRSRCERFTLFRLTFVHEKVNVSVLSCRATGPRDHTNPYEFTVQITFS